MASLGLKLDQSLVSYPYNLCPAIAAAHYAGWIGVGLSIGISVNFLKQKYWAFKGYLST